MDKNKHQIITMLTGLLSTGSEIARVFLAETVWTVLKAVATVLISAVIIDLAGSSIRRGLSHRIEEETILDLLESITEGVLWFTAILIVLGVLGFSEIAASLGTAVGFIALGVSLALKNVISDTVAGIYLAKDPDFNNGDKVKVEGSKGEIKTVGLRKSRIHLEDGNLRILNNSDVEKKWTKLS